MGGSAMAFSGPLWLHPCGDYLCKDTTYLSRGGCRINGHFFVDNVFRHTVVQLFPPTYGVIDDDDDDGGSNQPAHFESAFPIRNLSCNRGG